MNNTERSIIIIASMNKAEKRGFKIYCNSQETDKGYILLFDLIAKNISETYLNIETQFKEKSKVKSSEIAAGYLYKLLLDFLVAKRSEKRMQSKIYHLIEKANILFEKKLFDEAFIELNKADKYATLYEDDIMQIIISRAEMRFLSFLDFQNVTEKELVSKQMKLLGQVKYSRTINQYNFLLDLLNHRLLYKKMSNPTDKQRELDDLVLSELNLVSNNPDANFQSQKLHLLFQSSYHIEVGDYLLAVRNYKRLIALFSENAHLMLTPPIYYLSAIEGILDSLLSIGMYSDMSHFMDILRQLCKDEYPVYFQLKVLWFDYYYQISIILHTGAFEQIKEVQEYFEEPLIKKIAYLPLDVQLQFYLTNTFLLFSQKKYKEAHKTLKSIFAEGKIFQRFPMFRIVRLINILISAELGYLNFVEIEVPAFKRSVTVSNLSKTEKLVLQFVLSYPIPHFAHSRKTLWKSYKKKIDLIRNDKFERKLLKYFNFPAFIESRLTDVSLASILNASNSIQAD